MMHCLGFFHEQNRSDRDDYVRINWGNVRNGNWHGYYGFSYIWESILWNGLNLVFVGMQVNFDKASSYTTTAYGVSYDYGSVMHYSPTAFSRNGQSTITAKVSFCLKIHSNWKNYFGDVNWCTLHTHILTYTITHTHTHKHTHITKIVGWKRIFN